MVNWGATGNSVWLRDGVAGGERCGWRGKQGPMCAGSFVTVQEFGIYPENNGWPLVSINQWRNIIEYILVKVTYSRKCILSTI